MENTADFLAEGQERVDQFAVSRTAVNNQGQLITHRPFRLSAQHSDLFHAARIVPIQVDTHFANSHKRMLRLFKQSFHVVEQRFRVFGQFRRVQPHHGAAQVGMLFVQVQHGADAVKVDIRQQQTLRTCLNCPADYFLAVVVEFGCIDMCVGIDEHVLKQAFFFLL